MPKVYTKGPSHTTILFPPIFHLARNLSVNAASVFSKPMGPGIESWSALRPALSARRLITALGTSTRFMFWLVQHRTTGNVRLDENSLLKCNLLSSNFSSLQDPECGEPKHAHKCLAYFSRCQGWDSNSSWSCGMWLLLCRLNQCARQSACSGMP